ncbi:hypothetical protein MKX01_009557, partial [Papaver californicum]
MFETKGILCKHALSILTRHDVDLLPTKYILRRWRKDVRRAHTKIKVNLDDWNNIIEHKRYNELQELFSDVADMAVTVDEEYNDLKVLLTNKLKVLKLQQKFKGKDIESQVDKDAEKNTVNQVNEKGESNAEETLVTKLDPIYTKRNCRPPTNRITGRRDKGKTNSKGKKTT